MARLSYSPERQAVSMELDRSVATMRAPALSWPRLTFSNSSIAMEMEKGSCPDELAADQMRSGWFGLALISSGSTRLFSTSKG
ncbi:hypothetical protein D3C81_1717200 [compost metagenome]